MARAVHCHRSVRELGSGPRRRLQRRLNARASMPLTYRRALALAVCEREHRRLCCGSGHLAMSHRVCTCLERRMFRGRAGDRPKAAPWAAGRSSSGCLLFDTSSAHAHNTTYAPTPTSTSATKTTRAQIRPQPHRQRRPDLREADLRPSATPPRPIPHPEIERKLRQNRQTRRLIFIGRPNRACESSRSEQRWLSHRHEARVLTRPFRRADCLVSRASRQCAPCRPKGRSAGADQHPTGRAAPPEAKRASGLTPANPIVESDVQRRTIRVAHDSDSRATT
jgi:hypothetical protein